MCGWTMPHHSVFIMCRSLTRKVLMIHPHFVKLWLTYWVCLIFCRLIHANFYYIFLVPVVQICSLGYITYNLGQRWHGSICYDRLSSITKIILDPCLYFPLIPSYFTLSVYSMRFQNQPYQMAFAKTGYI
jgi:hypothetical protein